jgi:hypothetical protein
MLTRLFLALMGPMFLAFGAYSLFNPQALVTALDFTVTGQNGDYELRGIYGGVSLAASLLCFAGAARETLRRSALIFLLVYFGGYVFARAAALLLGPPPTSVYGPFIAFEIVCLILTLAALWATSKSSRPL